MARERGDVIIGDGNIKFGLEYRDLLNDQGVCLHALGDVDGEEVELLRFDCFDHEPHYHYGPEKRNTRLMLDKTTEGRPARLDAEAAQRAAAGYGAPRRI